MPGFQSGCPGQDARMLTTSLHKCPRCGHEVELFSDEQSAKCRGCGTRVSRDTTPSCVQWCASARRCLGEERWKALVGGLADGEDTEPAS